MPTFGFEAPVCMRAASRRDVDAVFEALKDGADANDREANFRSESGGEKNQKADRESRRLMAQEEYSHE